MCITNLLILYVYMYKKEKKDAIFLDINQDKSRSYLWMAKSNVWLKDYLLFILFLALLSRTTFFTKRHINLMTASKSIFIFLDASSHWIIFNNYRCTGSTMPWLQRRRCHKNCKLQCHSHPFNCERASKENSVTWLTVDGFGLAIGFIGHLHS
jgi:hypothetical protein